MSEERDLPGVDDAMGVWVRPGLDDVSREFELARLGYQPLVADLTACLAEAGIALHDCDGPGRSGGGCCLTPKAQRGEETGGIIVSWTCADGLYEDRYELHQTVQRAMAEALWAVLDGFGFPVVPFGMHDLPLVTGPREVTDEAAGQACAGCGRRFAALHYPQAEPSSGVCCDCWDGRVLVATEEHPEGEWVDRGRCGGVHLDQP